MQADSTYKSFIPWDNVLNGAKNQAGADDRSGSVYFDDPALKLAAEIAVVTQRPLLIQGEPGSGKSSFAPFVARNLKWRYYEMTVTGRMEARDLLWKFDALARLRDAHSQQSVDPARYITPGVLWWALNRDDALEFACKQATIRDGSRSLEASNSEPFAKLNLTRDPQRAVVLIDEIDKAGADVPNDLLEVISLNRFLVEEISRPVTQTIPISNGKTDGANQFGSLLIVMTTNQERDLPSAFMRRCVVHSIREPKEEAAQIQKLQQIAALHLGDAISREPSGEELVSRIAEKCCQMRKQLSRSSRRGPSTAEFLDAIRVCLSLGIGPDSEAWKQVEQSTFVK